MTDDQVLGVAFFGQYFKKIIDKYGLNDVGIELDEASYGTYCGSGSDSRTELWLRIFEAGIRLGLEAKKKPGRIEVPVKDGVLISEASGDKEDYPGIYTFLKRSDGTEVDLCYAEGKYHYADEDEAPDNGNPDATVQDRGVNVFV